MRATSFFVVQLVQRKYLWRFYVSKRKSAGLFSNRQSTAEVFFPLVLSSTTNLTCGCYKVITTYCVIFTFFCNNNNRRNFSSFQHPRADNCWMLRRRANNILRWFLCKQNFALLFRAKIKFCVFFRGTMYVIIFFVVQLVQQKYLWRFHTSKRNSAARFGQIEPKLSYLAIHKAQLNACAFSDGVEKQKCCLGPGDIKTVITFLLYNILIQNLAGCFVTAIATVPVIFTYFPFL